MDDVDGFVVVVAGGVVSDYMQLRAYAERADMVIAADSGADSLMKAGIAPHAVLGDMDSVSPDTLDWASDNHAVIERFPAEKDETDLQLALERAKRMGPKRILLFGALGGRLDHTLGNLSLLEPLSREGYPCWAVDGDTRVACITSSIAIEGSPGDLLSLIPLDGAVGGITTDGLAYPLVNGVLPRGGYPSGVSNVLEGERAIVRLAGGGAVLVVHTAVGCAQERSANR